MYQADIRPVPVSARSPATSSRVSVFTTPAPLQDSSSGWKADSTGRGTESGRFAPLATSATQLCSREKLWTIRDVSRHAVAWTLQAAHTWPRFALLLTSHVAQR